MADNDDSFPPEIQKSPSKFIFKELTHLKAINSTEQPEYPTSRSNLLAVANLYGLVFVGLPSGIKVYSSKQLIACAKSDNKEIQNVILVGLITLQNPPNWIAVNSNNLTLAVCCGPLILFFDVRNIANKSKDTKTPFCTFALSKAASTAVVSLHWNPSIEWSDLVAICTSTGSFHMLSIENTATEIGIRPDNFGACTVCWSPKGKQMVVGKNDGTLHQLTPKLEVKRSVSVTSVIDRPVRTSDILWLSTYQFAAAYIATDTEDKNFSQPNLFLANLPSKNENRDVIWRNYEDPCFGMNESHSPRYLMTFIEQWDMFITFSSNSTDSTLIAKNKDTQVWEIWTLDDSGRAQLPISEFTEDDSAPIGVAVITTATEKIYVDERLDCPPMPILLVLTNDGILCPFHIINFMVEYPSIMNKVTQIDLTGERTASGNKGTTSSEDLKQSATAKQKLTAKPSIPLSHPSSTPKHISSSQKPGMAGIFASTPFTKLPPFVAAEDHSFIQGSPTTQNKPPLTREVPLKTTPFAADKHPALDESTDSVFGSTKTGSSESAFSPSTVVTVAVKQEALEELPKPGLKRVTLGPTKPIFMSESALKVPTGVRGTGFVHQIPATLSVLKSNNVPTSVPSTTNNSPAETGSYIKQDFQVSKLKLMPMDSKGLAGNSEVSSDALRTKRSQESVGSRSSLSVESNSSETMNEVSSFEQELNDFLLSGPGNHFVHKILGSNEEKAEIKKGVECLCKFLSEISETTKELSSEIRDTSTVVLELLSAVEDSIRQHRMGKDITYRFMMYNKPLDPANQKKVQAIRGLYEYLHGSVREANTALDLEWEKMQEQKKIASRKSTIKIGEWENAYQALLNNVKVLHEQEIKITLLGQELDKFHICRTSLQPHARVGSFLLSDESPSQDSDLQRLADSLLLKREEFISCSSSNGKRNKQSGTTSSPASCKMSPKKQAQLGQMLVNRNATPVRSSGICNPSFVTKPVIRMHASPSSPIRDEPQALQTPDTLQYPPACERTEGSVAVFRSGRKDIQSPEFSRLQLSGATSSSESTSDSDFDFEKNEIEMVKEDPSSLTTDIKRPNIVSMTPTANDFDSHKLSSTTLSLTSISDSLPIICKPSIQPDTSTLHPIIPQGSATLAYGAPSSILSSNKARDFSSLSFAPQTEAASNLNNPPKVVNIQQLQSPALQEFILPEKFEATSDVPQGAAEVVQKVINTVKAEKQHPSKDWKPEDNQVTIVSSKESESLFTLNQSSASLFCNSNPGVRSQRVEKTSVSSAPIFGSSSLPSGDFHLKSSSPIVTVEPTTLPKHPGTSSATTPESPVQKCKVESQNNTGSMLQKSASFAGFSQHEDNVPVTAKPKVDITSLNSLAKDLPSGDKSVTMVTTSSIFSSTVFGVAGKTLIGSASPAFGFTSLDTQHKTITEKINKEQISQAVCQITTTAIVTQAASTELSQTSVFASGTSTVVSSGGSLFGTSITKSPSQKLFSTNLSSSGGSLSVNTSKTSLNESTSNTGVLEAVISSSCTLLSDPASITATSVFGSSTTLTSSANSSAMRLTVYGNIVSPNLHGTFEKPNSTASSSSSLFGSITSVSDSNSKVFESKVITNSGLLGTTSASTTATGGRCSMPSSGIVLGERITTATGSLFGVSEATAPLSVFGAMSRNAGSSSTLFGMAQTTGFGFVTTSAIASSVSESVFGVSKSPFNSTGSGFGGTTFGSNPTNVVFGSAPSTATQSNAFDGGFLGGLGGKPSEEAANKNPFAVGANSQQNISGLGSSLFGNSGAKSFNVSSSFGQNQQQKTTSFGELASGGVGSQGFGGFGKTQTGGGFGTFPSFGSAATFGSPPAFGSIPTQTFGGGFENQTSQNTGDFGSSSNQSGGFASFAKTETPGFGNLAQQTGAFGSFNQSQQQQSTFGGGFSSNTPKSPSFSGWR